MLRLIYKLFGWCYHEYGNWEEFKIASVLWSQHRKCKKCGYIEEEDI